MANPMINHMSTLATIRDRLAAISGVTSCKIGFEDNICADDYPMIRIVPVRNTVTQQTNVVKFKLECLIYFSVKIHDFEDTEDDDGYTHLERTYNALFALEREIRSIDRTGDKFSFKFEDSYNDRDDYQSYKMMAIRCFVDG